MNMCEFSLSAYIFEHNFESINSHLDVFVNKNEHIFAFNIYRLVQHNAKIQESGSIDKKSANHYRYFLILQYLNNIRKM